MKRPKVLICDDDIAFACTLRETLSARGYEVHLAHSANEALALLQREGGFSVCIVELKLPDKSGLELIAELKISHPALPIVVLTGYGSLPTAMKAISLGVVNYLEKPVNPDRLFLILANIITQKKLPSFNIAELFPSFGPGLAIIEVNQNEEAIQLIEYNNPFLAFFDFDEQELKDYLSTKEWWPSNQKETFEIKRGSKIARLFFSRLNKDANFYLLLLFDITDFENEKNLSKEIIKSNPFGLLILDEHFKIIDFNENLTRLIAPRKLTVGEFCYKLLREKSMPCYFIGEICPIIQAKSIGSSSSCQKVLFNRFLELIAVPLYNPKKEISFFSLFFVDQTELVEKERKLYQVKEEWERTFDAISDSIIVLNKDFEIIKANRATYSSLALRPSEVLSKKCYEVFHHKNEPLINCPALKALRTSHSYMEEVIEQDKVFLVTVSPIFDEHQNLFGFIHVAKDITGLKKIEKELFKKNQELKVLLDQLNTQKEALLKTASELERKNKELLKRTKAKDEFAQAVAHELKTPLTVIKEGINLLSNSSLGLIGPEQRKILKIAQNNVQQLTALINDLVDLSKIESGGLELFPESLDLRKALTELCHNFSFLIKEKKLNLTLSLKESQKFPLKAFVDKKAFERIMVNLLSNAIKNTQEGDEIKIEAGRMKDKLLISVKDTGIGIPESEQPKIFQKFASIVRVRDNKVSGGLGLALCKELVEKSSGSIWFKSEEHKGTTFYFTLPIYSEKLDLEYYKKLMGKKAAAINADLGLYTIALIPKKEEEQKKIEDYLFKIEKIFKEYVNTQDLIKVFQTQRRVVLLTIGESEDLKRRFYAIKNILCPFLNKLKIKMDLKIVNINNGKSFSN